METLLIILMVLTGIVNIICFVCVLKELWTENMVLGILCLIGTFITGIGGLVLFVWGWFQQELRPLMIAWTTGQVVMFILMLAYGAF
jgi:hypothetical protein